MKLSQTAGEKGTGWSLARGQEKRVKGKKEEVKIEGSVGSL